MNYPCVLLDRGGHSLIAFSEGRKYINAVQFGPSIALVKLERVRDLAPALLDEKPYPVARAARIFMRSGFPMTKRARGVLAGLRKRGAA